MSGFAQIDEKINRADEFMRSGRLDEAAQLWAQVRTISPNHPRALFHLGQHCLYRQDFAGAKELLQRAQSLMPKSPIVALNLAMANRGLGDHAGEAWALERALSIDPYFYPALLMKGALLERQGKSRLAARVYRDVIGILPPDDSIPVELKPAVEQAREAVRRNADALDAFLSQQSALLQHSDEPAGRSRFDECREVTLGRALIYTQRPTLLHFPRLPAIQFYNNDDFGWLKNIETATDAIRDELIAFINTGATGFEPYVNHPSSAPINQWAELNHSTKWSAYFLWSDGKPVPDHLQHFPRTAAALADVPLADVPRCAPSVFFSALDPHTRIPPHTGVTNTRLVVHLPLIVPPGCGFRVGNETRSWEPGHAWIFDDTIEHEAWNDGDRQRFILIFDIWNPYLDSKERDQVCALLNGIDDYYRSELQPV